MYLVMIEFETKSHEILSLIDEIKKCTLLKSFNLSKKKPGNFSVGPFNRRVYHRLFKKLILEDHEYYLEYTRMSPRTLLKLAKN